LLKNADFIGLAYKILDVALLKNPSDLEALKSLPLDGVSWRKKSLNILVL